MRTRDSTIAGLVEAVSGVAVAREDDDAVPALLKPHGRIHHQPLGAPDAQVRVQKDDCLFPLFVAGHLDNVLKHDVGWVGGVERQMWSEAKPIVNSSRQANRHDRGPMLGGQGPE